MKKQKKVTGFAIMGEFPDKVTLLAAKRGLFTNYPLTLSGAMFLVRSLLLAIPKTVRNDPNNAGWFSADLPDPLLTSAVWQT